MFKAADRIFRGSLLLQASLMRCRKSGMLNPIFRGYYALDSQGYASGIRPIDRPKRIAFARTEGGGYGSLEHYQYYLIMVDLERIIHRRE